MPDNPAIFISYRRSDAAGHARGLHEYLSRRFGGERIFFDRGTIESGDIFPETLRQGVEECAALLALIGPQWLDASDAEGRKRLDNSGDFVRTEIELALEHGKTVIPVLFDDTPVPPDSRLPEPLKPLAACNALTLRGKTYEYNTQRRELVRLLAKVPGIPEPYPDPGEEKPEPEGARLSELVALGTRPLEQLTEAQRETIEALKGQLGANANQLQAFFQIIGEAKVPVEQQWSRLNEIAAQYRELKVQVATEPGDAPEIARLKEKASVALDAGQLEQVDGLLSEVEAAQDTLLERQQREMDQQRLDRAATTAGRGGVALTRLRYREAAIHFAAAAERVPPQHEEQALDYLRQEAQALYRQGDEFGDNVALADAISRIKALLDTTIRERVPLDWAATQNNLGTALLTLGEREGGTARLEAAVAAYGVALEEWTRERVPLDWAMTQNNLGTALLALGQRESGTARLEEAVAAYGAALEEWTRERVPLDWAQTQNNLGTALSTLGAREIGTARLEEAVAAYGAALEERTRERVPLDWAMTQTNLGTALSTLGERESGTARLEDAVAAYGVALEEWTRERVPLDWAMTQNNLGTALLALGQRESGTARLEEAVAAYGAALEEWTRECVPLDWAMTQTNLGNALLRLGEREGGTARLEDAVAAYGAALEERTRECVPLEWAMTQTNLGTALSTLGEREIGTAHLEEAVAAYGAALSVFEAAGATHYASHTKDNLERGRALLAERRNS